MTGKQQRVLDFIRDFTAENGYPPSVREICRALGLKSPSSVHAHIKKLEQQGLILKGGSSARAIILNTPDKIGSGVKNIPVLGVAVVSRYLPWRTYWGLSRLTPETRFEYFYCAFAAIQ